MPVPKRKLSRKRRNQRSANKGIKPKAIAACQTCQAPVMPHQVCTECGYYKGAKVIQTKTDRMYKRGQAREARQASLKSQQPAQTPEQGGSEPRSE